MLKMMMAFFKDLWKYRKQVATQDAWMKKYVAKKDYALNPSWMMQTNLKTWLSEMELVYEKRYCPCFEPSGNLELDKKMLCPCKFIDEELEMYGTCHCALFGKSTLDKNGWAASSARLMSEYRVPLKVNKDVLDTRGQPLDALRGLPVPDAMHQLKNYLTNYPGATRLNMILQTEQEWLNLQKVAAFRGFGVLRQPGEDGGILATISLDGQPLQGSAGSCGQN